VAEAVRGVLSISHSCHSRCRHGGTPSFIHHNQFFKGDRQSLLTAMQDASKTSPNKSVEITPSMKTATR
jgi:hypothetical protein